jgi:hypothetical protein
MNTANTILLHSASATIPWTALLLNNLAAKKKALHCTVVYYTSPPHHPPHHFTLLHFTTERQLLPHTPQRAHFVMRHTPIAAP